MVLDVDATGRRLREVIFTGYQDREKGSALDRLLKNSDFRS